jgi:hypothetical protein
LTRAGPSTAADEPDRFYPTRVRNFARTVRGDDGQGLALGTLARDRGVRRLYLLDDGDGTGYANARYVRQAAAKLGVAIAGSSSWPDGPEGVPAFTRRVVAARPDGVLLAGCFCTGGYEVLAALRRVLPRGTVYLGSDAMLGPWHPASEGLLTTSAGRSAEGADADARRLLRRLGPRRALASFEGFVLEAAAATETLLEAIAGSDGSRGGVVNALQSAKGFDGRGDPVEGVYTVYRHSRSGREHPEREVPGLRFEQTLVVRPR